MNPDPDPNPDSNPNNPNNLLETIILLGCNVWIGCIQSIIIVGGVSTKMQNTRNLLTYITENDISVCCMLCPISVTIKFCLDTTKCFFSSGMHECRQLLL